MMEVRRVEVVLLLLLLKVDEGVLGVWGEEGD